MASPLVKSASSLLCVAVLRVLLRGFLLKITLKMGKNTQKEIAALMIIVTTSAKVSPPAPITDIAHA